MKKRMFLTGLLILFIVAYFWTQSRYPSLNNKAMMAGSAAAEDSLVFEALVRINHADPLYKQIVYSTVNWVWQNRQGMAFGILLATAILTLLRFLPERHSHNPFINALKGTLAGAPLGVCANCATPIAKGMYDAGAHAETALATLFSSPTLNVVVLGMIFSLFPLYMSITKVVASLVFILLVVPLFCIFVFKIQNNSYKIPKAKSFHDENWLTAVKETGKTLARSFWYICKTTIPLMLLAGFLGTVLVKLVPLEKLIDLQVNWLTLALASFVGTFLPIPMAFDIVVVRALMMAGLKPAFVGVLLFTLGIFSIYPFFIIWKTMSRKVAIVLFGTVMLFGIASGMIVQAYDNHAMQKMLDMFDANFANQNLPRIKSDEITAAVPVAFESALQSNSELFYESPDIIIRSIDHIKRNAYSESPFTRFDGNGFGFNTYHEFVPLDLSTPFSMGRGISSGDYDNDGWPDVVLSTSKGILLYKNLGTNKFALQQIIVPDLNALVVAFVDINNDGWLDIYVTSYGGDNHFILSDGASFDQPEIINVPNTGALATASSSFGDINKDGWLDFVNGNWFFENSLPVDEATNKLIINRALEFEEKDFDRPGASTLSILFTDFNNDNNLDLIEGNDFEEPDIYYVGNGEGELRKITKTEGMIPITTLETMSIDTADINNDLLPDIYLGGISISFSQGKDKKKRFDEYCSDLKNNEIKSECEKYVNTVIAVRETDLEQCSTFADSDKNECMVMVMLRLAIQKRDERLCEKIPEAYQLHKSICHKYFTPSPLVSYADSIQQHANVNILLQGMSDGTFKDASQMGVSGGFWTWNAKFADLDNDEWQDIYVANGFWELRDLFSNVFFHNNNGKDFSAMQEQSGLENFLSVNTYTYIDIDNDGDMDIISVTTHGLIEVYINNEHENNAVTFEFRDEQGNVYGIGNKIYIYYDSNAQFREIKSGGGFMSFDAPIAHFGLGKHDKIDRIEIVWSTGEKTTIEKNFTANKRYLMTRKHITSVAAH